MEAPIDRQRKLGALATDLEHATAMRRRHDARTRRAAELPVRKHVRDLPNLVTARTDRSRSARTGRAETKRG